MRAECGRVNLACPTVPIMSTTTLADIERLCWHLSGWNVEQRAVDELLAAIRDHMGCGCAGAAAPLDSGGPGEAVSAPVRPVESLPASLAVQETLTTVNGPQAGVQSLHVTGTLTLVCTAPHAAAPQRVMPVREAVPDGTKRCTKCTELKPVDQFNRKSKDRPTLRSHCRACEADRKRKAA